jgi:hypothetical protein
LFDDVQRRIERHGKIHDGGRKLPFSRRYSTLRSDRVGLDGTRTGTLA